MGMEVIRTYKGITPILQSLLIQQMKTINEALNEKDYWVAWERLKVLVDLVPPSVWNKCIQEINTLQNNLNQVVSSTRDMDFYSRSFHQNDSAVRLLRNNLHRLYRLVSVQLYEGGYLEKTGEVERGHEINYLEEGKSPSS